MTATRIDEPANALVTPESLERIISERDSALAGWLELHATYHQQRAELDRWSFGGLTFSAPSGQHGPRHCVTKAWLNPNAANWAEVARNELDRRCWHGLADKVKAADLLDRQGREDLSNSLNAETVAEFTLENVAATFGHLWDNRRQWLLRGVANAFSRLDRRFRSHNGFKIGSRVIMPAMLDTEFTVHWSVYRRESELAVDDVNKALHEIAGAPLDDTPLSRLLIEHIRKEGLPCEFETEFLTIRAFKNGNLHLWFPCPEIHHELNQLLAEYYGEVIGNAHESARDDDEAPAYHVTPAKNFGEFFTSDDMAKRLAARFELNNCEVLEPSAGNGALALAAQRRGCKVDCVEIQPKNAAVLRTVHGLPTVERDFLTMKPTKLYDAVFMNPPFDRGRDCDHVRHAMQFVKPGGKLIAIMAARAEFGDDKRHRALHREIEKWDQICHVGKWHDQPAGSFAHAGTQVNVTVLAIQKPTKGA